MSDAKPAPQDPRIQMERLDGMIAAEKDEERIRAGLGMRLALGMAQELKEGKPFGTDTAELVSAWMHDYGQDTVDAAVKVAREFLTKPEEMRKALARRLGLDGGHSTPLAEDAGDPAGPDEDVPDGVAPGGDGRA